MMIITGRSENGSITLQTSDPVSGKIQTVVAPTADAALRVAYFWYRLYICEKLKSWTYQRIYAIRFSNDAGRLEACAKLIAILQLHNSNSLANLATIIYGERDLIAFIAPGVKSNHYKIYQHLVLPIIDFCKSIAEGQVLTISKSE
jgi:hypothetical protein